MPGVHTPEFVEKLSSEICEAVGRAAFEPKVWQEATDAMTRAFPGSFATIMTQDARNGELLFKVSSNVDPEYEKSYETYFSRVNPWPKVWDRLPSGSVLISERHNPSRLYRGTEFYEDWLAPQGNAEAAVGLKIASGSDFLIHMPVHYGLEMAPRYDAAAAAVLHRIKGTLLMAARATRSMSEAWHSASAETAVGMRPDPVFVVDARLRLAHMNAAAECAPSDIVKVARGCLKLLLPEADTWLNKTFQHAAKLSYGLEWARAFSGNGRDFLVEIFPLPQPDWSPLYPVRRQFAVVLRDLHGQHGRGGAGELARFYGLTAAEQRLCEVLAEGLSVRECSEMLRVTEETVRKRLKSIFNKTDTHRQAQLVALILRFLGSAGIGSNATGSEDGSVAE